MYFPATSVLTILEMLQSRQRLSWPELAARLEVNTRTVRRYIRMLQDLGFPIEAERGRHGFYRLRPGFKLPPLMFTEEEAQGLTLGLLAVRRLGLTVAPPAVEGALAKIERVLPPILPERVRAVQETLSLTFPPASTTPKSERTRLVGGESCSVKRVHLFLVIHREIVPRLLVTCGKLKAVSCPRLPGRDMSQDIFDRPVAVHAG